VEVLVLGPVLLRQGGASLEVPGRKERALLAATALQPRRFVSVERLVELLWGQAAPQDPEQALRVHASRLRQSLPEGLLQSGAGGYALDLADEHIDHGVFLERAGAAARARDAEDLAAARDELRRALALLRGDPLTGLPDTEACAGLRSEVAELVLGVRVAAVEVELDAGQPGRAISELARLCAEHPYREPIWQLRMRALAADGRQAEALAVFGELRHRLAEDLGLDPDAATATLHADLLSQRLPVAPRRPAPLPHEPRLAVARHLPLPPTSFVGRDEELAELLDLAGAKPLVTVVGAGGTGKTRLVVEAARRWVNDDADPPRWVELAALEDPSLLDRVVADAVEVPSSAGGRAALADRLARMPCVLVLDNCEHLLAAVADLAQYLLARCPDLHIIATSREPLGVYGETVLRLLALAVPPPEASNAEAIDSPAVRLFADRACSARPAFRLDEVTTPAVVTVCRQLDGIPLALELAASLLRGLSIETVAERLGDRFDLLRASRSAGPPRQQTLENLVSWSYQLLEAPAQALWRQLSVFSGGFSLAAAEAVVDAPSGEVLSLLLRLVDASVVTPLVTDGEPARYALNETLREYGAARLGREAGATWVRDRHLDWALGLALSAAAHLRARDQGDWFDLLAVEQPNLRAALAWAEQTAPARAVEIAASVWRSWEANGAWFEGIELIERAVAAAPDRTPVLVEALDGLGMLLARLDRWAEAEVAFRRAASVAREAGDPRGLALAHGGLAFALMNLSRYERHMPEEVLPALQLAEAGLRAAGDEAGLSRVLFSTSNYWWWHGDLPRRRESVEQAIAVAERCGNLLVEGFARHTLAAMLHDAGDPAGALAEAEQALTLFKQARNSYGIGLGTAYTALLRARAGQHGPYRDLVVEGVPHLWRVRFSSVPREWLECVDQAITEGHCALARQLLDATAGLGEAASDTVIARRRQLLKARLASAAAPQADRKKPCVTSDS
jgi:predicted ATPase/DNA-binding SARP family transcriptional activator